jgi:hypothetical protein
MSFLETTLHPATPSLPNWSLSWRKVFTAFMAARQKRADYRIAMYLRSVPAGLVRRLDLPPDVTTALRDREKWTARATFGL